MLIRVRDEHYDPSLDEHEETTVVVSFEDQAREKALELAEQQVPDEEIEAALIRRCRQSRESAVAIVSSMAEDLLCARLDGRARIREFAASVARGESGGMLSSSQIAVLSMLGSQHLGWTKDPPNEKVRKIVEKSLAAAEKQAAKAKKEGAG